MIEKKRLIRWIGRLIAEVKESRFNFYRRAEVVYLLRAMLKEIEGAPELYRCSNINSENWGEWTGLCCEDECPDGEREEKNE